MSPLLTLLITVLAGVVVAAIGGGWRAYKRLQRHHRLLMGDDASEDWDGIADEMHDISDQIEDVDERVHGIERLIRYTAETDDADLDIDRFLENGYHDEDDE